ncbi:sulfotransferase family 2 domain-containing protein [Alphaproteobacteria bacterium KMM 3653]|uniref:Sulfotransferase family 2 domain-containing protein n=1 Tax=Harenicola maris TaxID=2841044 RepID=A0AAP2CSI0_9RHOB|nr:sulfotransferase family 2 domain-containing protein [Harenicola maris]
MPVHLWKQKVSYVSVPKCACSSVKHLFFEIENGYAFRNMTVNGERFTVHGLYESVPFEALDLPRIADHHIYAVVRHPVDRIVSCYRDKVARRNTMDRPGVLARLKAANLNPAPDLETFVRNLEGYRAASPMIRRHSHKLSFFLGTDPARYAGLYDISQLEDMASDVLARTGAEVPLQHRNRTTGTSVDEPVSASVRALIEEDFASDLDIFGSSICPSRIE